MQLAKWFGVLAIGLVAGAALSQATSPGTRIMADDKKPSVEKQIVHNVYFSLKESTPAGRQKLVDACKKLLSGHDGCVYFSAGEVSDRLTRDVNDRDWDVGLHIVFDSMASHDKYQDHPRHTQFIDENKSTWAKVRVFDTEVE
jgi:hypothetical protein